MPRIVRHEFRPDPDGRPTVTGAPRCTCGRPQSAPEHSNQPEHPEPTEGTNR